VNISHAVPAGRWIEKKRTVGPTEKSHKGLCFHLFGEKPTEAICIKNCLVGDLLDVITSDKFQNEIFRGYVFIGVRIFHFPIDFN